MKIVVADRQGTFTFGPGDYEREVIFVGDSALVGDERKTMKAISLWAPWSSLVIDGRKKIETRHWPAPKYLIGGDLAIHATKFVDSHYAALWGYDAKTIPRGAILGYVRLEKCEQFTQEFTRSLLGTPEFDYGDFTPGRWGWFVTVLEKFETPFQCKGARSIFNWEIPT